MSATDPKTSIESGGSQHNTIENISKNNSITDKNDNDKTYKDSSESEGDWKELNDIGNFATLKLPSFSWRNKTTDTHNSEGNTLSKAYQDMIQSRREQLTNLIDDLKEGFSLKSALDRFQTIKTLLESEISQTIENSVDTDSENEDEGNDDEGKKKLEEDQSKKINAEPQVVKAAVEPREIPLLDQVIIPQSKDPERKIHRKRQQSDHHDDHQIYQGNPELEKLTSIEIHEANDQSVLRRKIKTIRRLSISENSKNHMIQKLMMGAHYDKIKFVDSNGEEVLKISNKYKNDKISTNNQPEHSTNNLKQEDTSNQAPKVIETDKLKTYNDEDQDVLGCPHYQRNCQMECPKCRRWYVCPICHDEDTEHTAGHKFQRNKTEHILCMECFTPQKPDEFCSHCDLKFASYYCATCVLYDNDETKDIYHCESCGICRLGLGLGQDFFHCEGCNACLAIELQNDHKCIERSIESDCPICGEFMFTSTKPVVFMSCGHAIHQSCYDEHSKHSYKCPTCQKSVLNMEAQFRVLDMEIRLQPLPHPYSQWTCIIRCNDCNAKSSTPYHVLGLKCDNCKSYNTAQLKLIKPEEANNNNITTDNESDISTTTNELRKHTKVRDLKYIAINSSNLLNKNFNKEHLDFHLDENIGRSKSAVSAKSTELFNNGSLKIGEEVLELEHEQEKDNDDEDDNVLTLPRKFMSNFDQYITNLQEYYSSSDEDYDQYKEDDVDFLHVNKTFTKFQNNMTNQMNSFNNENTNVYTKTQNVSNVPMTLSTSNTFVTNITNAFNNFLTSIDHSQETRQDEDMGNETDDEMEVESDNDEVPLIEDI